MSEVVLTKAVPLLVPVEHDGKTYAELTLHRMKVRDTLVAEDELDDERAGLMVFARMARVPLDVILDLDFEDFTEVTAAAVPLMGKRAVELMKGKGVNLSPGET
jgi:NAD(P)H-flavin reductase